MLKLQFLRKETFEGVGDHRIKIAEDMIVPLFNKSSTNSLEDKKVNL
jgi:hypothetical protein